MKHFSSVVGHRLKRAQVTLQKYLINKNKLIAQLRLSNLLVGDMNEVVLSRNVLLE